MPDLANGDIGPQRKMSVKRGKNGKVEIHQQIPQEGNIGTDLEIESVDLENGQSSRFDVFETDKPQTKDGGIKFNAKE